MRRKHGERLLASVRQLPRQDYGTGIAAFVPKDFHQGRGKT
jgi:hypothetical protein